MQLIALARLSFVSMGSRRESAISLQTDSDGGIVDRPITERKQRIPDPIMLTLTARGLTSRQALAFLLIRQHRRGITAKALSTQLALSLTKTRMLIRSLQTHRLVFFNGSTVRALKPRPHKMDAIILALDNAIQHLQNPSHR